MYLTLPLNKLIEKMSFPLLDKKTSNALNGLDYLTFAAIFFNDD